QFADECYKLNPSERVPVLVHNGHSICESLAIIEYIDEIFPGVALLPKDPVKRATARALALHIASGIQPLQNLKVMQKLNAEEAGKGQKWSEYWLTAGLKELEKMVEKTAGRLMVGDDVTVADICLPSILYNARRMGTDVAAFPTLLRIEKELEKIDAFEKALPENQPDAQKA
ncbi:hypothetical protein PFISCL1PPCAC_28927, partial [Pristionchus fissidentatus]